MARRKAKDVRSDLRTNLQAVERERMGLVEQTNKLASYIGSDPARQRAKVRKLQAFTAARRGPASSNYAGAMDEQLRRAKVRQQMGLRGEQAIRSQSLQNRIAFAKQGVARKGALLQAQGTQANIRQGMQDKIQQAKDATGMARAGMFGSIAGGLTQMGIDRGWFNFGGQKVPTGAQSDVPEHLRPPTDLMSLYKG